MAHVFKLNKVWYVRYKDQAGHWQKKSCGRDATKSDANAVAQQKGALELNYRHKLPVRLIKITVESALTQFRDEIIPIPKTSNTTKQESSVRREKAVVNNFSTYLEEKGLTQFNQLSVETIRAYFQKRNTSDEVMPKTFKEERRVLNNFFKWTIETHVNTENPIEKIPVPLIPKKPPRYFSKEELDIIFNNSTDTYRSIFKFPYLL